MVVGGGISGMQASLDLANALTGIDPRRAMTPGGYIDARDAAAVRAAYADIWRLFYLEYVAFPAAAWLAGPGP